MKINISPIDSQILIQIAVSTLLLSPMKLTESFTKSSIFNNELLIYSVHKFPFISHTFKWSLTYTKPTGGSQHRDKYASTIR